MNIFGRKKSQGAMGAWMMAAMEGLLLVVVFPGWSGVGVAGSHVPAESASVELIRAVYEQDARAIVMELLIPDVDEIEQLSRIELLISYLNDGGGKEEQFALILNYSDRVDPVPPGNFGIVTDPASDDRSIRNVSSAAGVPGRFDQASPRGSLLKQSIWGVINGDLGISIWVAPKGWRSGRYLLETRLTAGKSRNSWRRLTEFVFTGEEIENLVSAECLVRPVFISIPHDVVIPFEDLGSVTLVRYQREPVNKEVSIKRWLGDSQTGYLDVEVERQEFKPEDLRNGLIVLKPGVYQLKHNSVSGRPPSGYYGASSFFEIKAEDCIREIKVLLYPAI